MNTKTTTILDNRGSPISPETIEAIRRTSPDRYPETSRIRYSPFTRAGVRIDADQALRVSAVWACVRFLSETVAKLDWNLRRRNVRDEGSLIQRNNPTQYILNERVSDEFSSMQFRETMMRWALLRGNAYAEIEWTLNGRPYALHPLHPSRVTLLRDVETNELVYEYVGDNGVTILNQWDVFHLRGMGEGPAGLSVIEYAAESIGWAQAAQLFGSSFFRRSANPSGVVSAKQSLSPEALAVLRREFEMLYSGSTNSNKTVFLDADMEYTSISTDPDKSQFIETNQFLLDEICRWFGVPPHKIYNLLRATFSNIEHQSIEVVVDSIWPWAKRLQDEADFKLLGENRAGLFTRIETDDLLKADTQTRMAYYQGMRNVGALNANEIRTKEGLNPIGPDGDKYTMQSGMTTLDKIGADLAPKEPASPPAPEPAPPQKSVSDELAVLAQRLMIETAIQKEFDRNAVSASAGAREAVAA